MLTFIIKTKNSISKLIIKFRTKNFVLSHMVYKLLCMTQKEANIFYRFAI